MDAGQGVPVFYVLRAHWQVAEAEMAANWALQDALARWLELRGYVDQEVLELSVQGVLWQDR